MLPLVRLLDGQGTVVIRSSEATDGVGRDERDLTRKSADVAGTSRNCDVRCARVSGDRRPVAFRRPQVQLPPAHVPPLVVLVADVLVDADRLEAEGFVDADARVVRQGDPGDEQAEAAFLEAPKELRV